MKILAPTVASCRGSANTARQEEEGGAEESTTSEKVLRENLLSGGRRKRGRRRNTRTDFDVHFFLSTGNFGSIFAARHMLRDING